MYTDSPTLIMTLMGLLMASTLAMLVTLVVLAVKGHALLGQVQQMRGQVEPKLSGVNVTARLLQRRMMAVATVARGAAERLQPRIETGKKIVSRMVAQFHRPAPEGPRRFRTSRFATLER
jgi:hypothetical protein